MGHWETTKARDLPDSVDFPEWVHGREDVADEQNVAENAKNERVIKSVEPNISERDAEKDAGAVAQKDVDILVAVAAGIE